MNWIIMIARTPIADVAHPGVARSVKARIKITARIPRPPSAETHRQAVRRRAPIISAKTDIALSPCDTRDEKFIRDFPAIRFPRGIGTILNGILDRKTAAA